MKNTITVINGSGPLNTPARLGIVVSRFNFHLCDSLLRGCLDSLRAAGLAEDRITVVWVPGAFEIPFVARRMALSGAYDAIIALGAVIRGETPHFDYVAAECARGVAEAAAETDVPVIFGVLTTDSEEQAVDRIGGRHGHKGADAAQAALSLLNVLHRLAL